MSKKRLEKKTARRLVLVVIFALTILGGGSYTSNVSSRINIWDLGVFFRFSWVFLVYFLLLTVLSVTFAINNKGRLKILGLLLAAINIVLLFVTVFFFSTAGGWSNIF